MGLRPTRAARRTSAGLTGAVRLPRGGALRRERREDGGVGVLVEPRDQPVGVEPQHDTHVRRHRLAVWPCERDDRATVTVQSAQSGVAVAAERCVPASARYCLAWRRASIDDVQREPQRDVECRPRDLIESTDWFIVKIFDWHRDDVVATDDAAFGQSLLGTDLDLGADTTNCPGDRCARDRAQHCDGGITAEDADRSASSGRPEVGPEYVVSSYHVGAVRAARRRAD